MASEDGSRKVYLPIDSTNEEAGSTNEKATPATEETVSVGEETVPVDEHAVSVDGNAVHPGDSLQRQTGLSSGPPSRRQTFKSSSLDSSGQYWPDFSGLGAVWDGEDSASLQRAVPSAILPDSSAVRLVPRVGQLRVANPDSPDPLADFVLPPNTDVIIPKKSYWATSGPVSREDFDEYKEVTEAKLRTTMTQMLLGRKKAWDTHQENRIEIHELRKHISTLENSLRKSRISSRNEWKRGVLRDPKPRLDPAVDQNTYTSRHDSKTAFLYTNLPDRARQVAVESILTRADIAKVRKDWVGMDTMAGYAGQLAAKLNYEPLNARCEFYRGIALVGQLRYDIAQAVFESSRPAVGVYINASEFEEWVRKAKHSDSGTRTKANSTILSSVLGRGQGYENLGNINSQASTPSTSRSVAGGPFSPIFASSTRLPLSRHTPRLRRNTGSQSHRSDILSDNGTVSSHRSWRPGSDDGFRPITEEPEQLNDDSGSSIASRPPLPLTKATRRFTIDSGSSGPPPRPQPGSGFSASASQPLTEAVKSSSLDPGNSGHASNPQHRPSSSISASRPHQVSNRSSPRLESFGSPLKPQPSANSSGPASRVSVITWESDDSPAVSFPPRVVPTGRRFSMTSEFSSGGPGPRTDTTQQLPVVAIQHQAHSSTPPSSDHYDPNVKTSLRAPNPRQAFPLTTENMTTLDRSGSSLLTPQPDPISRSGTPLTVVALEKLGAELGPPSTERLLSDFGLRDSRPGVAVQPPDMDELSSIQPKTEEKKPEDIMDSARPTLRQKSTDATTRTLAPLTRTASLEPYFIEPEALLRDPLDHTPETNNTAPGSIKQGDDNNANKNLALTPPTVRTRPTIESIPEENPAPVSEVTPASKTKPVDQTPETKAESNPTDVTAPADKKA